ncbi:helix-hairpin-helix domain-containing protein [soil metagenome]
MKTKAGFIYQKSLKDLQRIPGVGKSIANDLWEIGIKKVEDLIDQNPQKLYDKSNRHVGVIQDRCLLYVFRCAVYYASNTKHETEKLNWWRWKEVEKSSSRKRQSSAV